MKGMLKVALAALVVAPLYLGQISAGQQAASGGQIPAGATGLCKDGTYWTSPTKSGACRGHKGIDKWFADQGTTPAKAAKPSTSEAPQKAAPAAAPPPAPTPAPAAAPSSHSSKQEAAARTSPAPGGGPGLVWVNTDSKVYHCPGTRYYGTTKQGKYMSESEALHMGARADSGKACK